MFDPEHSPLRARAERELAERLRVVRMELYGENGGPVLAALLSIPQGTWSDYEIGVTIPAEILLALLELTRAEPSWLLSGSGLKYRQPATDRADWWGHQRLELA